MPQHWFFLGDPLSYHLDQLFEKGKDVWDGIHGANALKYLAQVKKGDLIIGYHTAPLKAAYALLEAVSDAYPDPKEDNERFVVVDVKGVRKFPSPVPLATMKADKKLEAMKFIVIPRMAVSPLTPAEFREILHLAGEK